MVLQPLSINKTANVNIHAYSKVLLEQLIGLIVEIPNFIFQSLEIFSLM